MKLNSGRSLMAKLVIGLAAVGLATTFSLSAYADVKIGYIDLQKAIQTTSVGKKAKAELQGEFDKRKKDIEKKEADIKKMTEDLEKKKAVLSEEALGKKQTEIQEEMMKYRELVGKNQLEIQKKEHDLTAPILEKLRTIIDKMAKAEGYSVILEKSEQNVLWVKGDLDMTEKVVAEFEKTK